MESFCLHDKDWHVRAIPTLNTPPRLLNPVNIAMHLICIPKLSVACLSGAFAIERNSKIRRMKLRKLHQFLRRRE